LLVSDVGMADEDGYSLVRRVRALGAEEGGTIPAIALTAYTRNEDRSKALAAGFTSHLGKPIDIESLLAAIASLAPSPRR
jgi:CheY-like chemotaxis protein